MKQSTGGDDDYRAGPRAAWLWMLPVAIVFAGVAGLLAVVSKLDSLSGWRLSGYRFLRARRRPR